MLKTKNKVKKLTKLIFSDRFLYVLNNIKKENIIARKLLFINDNSDYGYPYSYIDIVENKNDYISYTPVNKIDEFISKDIWVKNRNSQKIGRFIYQLLGDDSARIESFVNIYKAEIKLLNNNNNFELIKGKDISNFYSERSYKPGGGSLNKSCMRHDRCQDYFYFYTANENKVNLLILKDSRDPSKIIGRALVWYIDDPKITFMDRIYTTLDSDFNLFIKYAKSKGWYYKLTQGVVERSFINPINDKEIQIKCKIFLKDEEYQYYPYLDTFYFFDIKNNYLTNDENEYSTNKNIIKLKSTDGGNKGNENFIYDKYNKDFISINSIEQTLVGDHLFKRDVISGFSPDEIIISEYDWKLYSISNVIWSYYHNTYIFRNNVFKVFLNKDGTEYDYIHSDFKGEIYSYVMKKDSYFIKDLLIKGIDNKYYFKDEYDEEKIKEKMKNKDRFKDSRKLNKFFDSFITEISNVSEYSDTLKYFK